MPQGLSGDTAGVVSIGGVDVGQLQLLEMRSGLEFVEDYVDDSVSHCIEMLFGAGVADTAAYAASQRLIHAPGEVFNYSSGTTNIVSRILGASLGGGQEARRRAACAARRPRRASRRRARAAAPSPGPRSAAC